MRNPFKIALTIVALAAFGCQLLFWTFAWVTLKGIAGHGNAPGPAIAIMDRTPGAVAKSSGND
jgi:hypothetical protein